MILLSSLDDHQANAGEFKLLNIVERGQWENKFDKSIIKAVLDQGAVS